MSLPEYNEEHARGDGGKEKLIETALEKHNLRWTGLVFVTPESNINH